MNRHRTRLDQYRDSDGYVIEEKQADYDEARISTAFEASDHLDNVLDRLADLVGPPAPRAFTLTFAGSERHDGQAPTSFVVNAINLDDAARVLATLPGFLDWYLADAAACDHGVDIVHVPEQSHPGVPAPGRYVDLLPEQGASAAPAGIGTTSTPPPAAAPSLPPSLSR
ncbi:hypothetical protein RKD23_001098 [Streptomyces sp. SAI-170]|uniref:hypothetical protein n=1 Tax=Streptomyces sp. SAI-170 TaxID=3377729 RepID=UPI003C7A7267